MPLLDFLVALALATVLMGALYGMSWLLSLVPSNLAARRTVMRVRGRRALSQSWRAG